MNIYATFHHDSNMNLKQIFLTDYESVNLISIFKTWFIIQIYVQFL